MAKAASVRANRAQQLKRQQEKHPVYQRMFELALSQSLQLEKVLAEPPPEYPGKAPSIASITVAQWRRFKTLVLSGVSGVIAAQSALFFDSATYKQSMAEGAKAKPGTLEHQFSASVRAAECTARSIAEARIYYDDPQAWLRGPGGKSTVDEPGWTEESIVKHTDPTGTKSPEVTLRFTVDGPVIEAMPVLPPAKAEDEAQSA